MSNTYTRLKPLRRLSRKARKKETAAKTYWNNYFNRLNQELGKLPVGWNKGLFEPYYVTDPTAKQLIKEADEIMVDTLKKNNPHLIIPRPSSERVVDTDPNSWIYRDEAGQKATEPYKRLDRIGKITTHIPNTDKPMTGEN
jgi:hypothetical protein